MRSGSSSKRFRGRPEIHWPQKSRAAIRVETRDFVSAHPLTSMEQNIRWTRKMWRSCALSQVHSASHVGLCTCVMKSVEKKASRSSELRRCGRHVELVQKGCHNKRRLEQGEEERIGGMLSTIDLAAGAPPWCRHHVSCQQTSLLAVADLGSETASPGPDSRCTRLETPSTEEEVNCAAASKVADPTSEESQASN